MENNAISGIRASKQNPGNGNSLEGGNENQSVSVGVGQCDQRSGRRQKHTHSISQLETHTTAARLVGRQFEDSHGKRMVCFNKIRFLTRYLQCASISPADSNYVETISTLRYAGRAKSIQNRAHVNEEPKDALLRHFQEEIAELKKQLEDGLLLDVDVDGMDNDAEDDDDDQDDDADEEDDDDDTSDGVIQLMRVTQQDEVASVVEAKEKKNRRRKSKLINDAKESEKSEAEKAILQQKALENEKELKQAKWECGF